MMNWFKFGKNELIMETNETIERTLELMKNLPEEEQKKVSLFAEKLLAEIDDMKLVKGMMRLQEMSPRAFEFLEDGEVYTEKDVKYYYED